MSNNNSSNNNSTNNNTRNVYHSMAGRISSGNLSDNDEMEQLLQPERSQSQVSSGETSIDIEHDTAPGTSQQHMQRQQRLQQLRRDMGSTRINMETSMPNSHVSSTDNGDDRQRFRNIFSMLREARQQLNRSQSLREPHPIVGTANGENMSHPRTWRENLYEVLASPVTPRTDVLRALFTPTSTANVRYNSLPTNNVLPEEQFQFLLNRQGLNPPDAEIQSPFRNQNHVAASSSSFRLSRQNSRLTDENTSLPPQSPTALDLPIENNGNSSDNSSRRQSNAASSTNGSGGRQLQRQTSNAGSGAPTIDMIDDADTNAMGEMIVKLVTQFFRYLPFIFVLFAKFIHDHLLGILDILLLHGVVFHLNKSLKDQIAKLNQKSYAFLVRDILLVICVVSYRFILSNSPPDPFGLLICPPGATITLDMSTMQNSGTSNDLTSDVLKNYLNSFTNSKQKINEVPSTINPMDSKISVTKTISLGTLLYYVAVNDLILKLLTQLIKIIVTMLPTKVIRHKSRARLYALIEYTSQFYRALAPMRIWLTYLFETYTGLEVISGILFSAFYLGAKGFEFFERGKPLKKALVNFIRNMDYDRKPTKDELEAAGTICPICHDSFTMPVVLECSHIFCDECVNTWFKREQTCPMCRAKVSEDPTWQDGATTYFYQLY